jgi:hypothetical protein
MVELQRRRVFQRTLRRGGRDRPPEGGVRADPLPPQARLLRVGRVGWVGLLGGAMLGAAPAVAQNAAVIPVSAVVIEVPGGPAAGAWATPASWIASGAMPGRPLSLGQGIVMVVPERVEPDRLRVRLEYVAN